MRLAHFVFAATILTFPRSATAGIWGWFDKPSEPEVKEDALPIATEDAPSVEASLSVDTTSEDEPVVNSLPVEEVPVETISHIDPLLSSAPNFVAWFRSHGGYGAYNNFVNHPSHLVFVINDANIILHIINLSHVSSLVSHQSMIA